MINVPKIIKVVTFCLAAGYSVTAEAQFIDTTAQRVKTPLKIDYKKIGTIQPRSTQQIEASRLTIGCETLDRDYADFNAYKDYLPPLGIKKIRLQSGWGKTEKQKGIYNWKWLDSIIDFATANKLVPWLEVSYGNPVYNGGGGTGLLNSMPTSAEGYAAWDRYVAAIVTRYKGRVNEWEIWNEPDHPLQSNLPETVAKLNLRTATIIKAIQPDAKIAGLAFASHSDTEYFDRFLKVIADSAKMDLFTWFSYHSYAMRPEDAYRTRGVPALQKVLAGYTNKVKLRQGENGAPSTYIPSYALDKYFWTEYSQAKYDMRRVLGDLGRDIETSVFTIIDIRYPGKETVMNKKGLIESDMTLIAIRPKVAYYGMQNIAAIFDNKLNLTPAFGYTTESKESMSVFGYTQDGTDKHAVTLWLDGKIPSNAFTTTPTNITLQNVKFTQPVYVDLMTGHIYDIPANAWSKQGNSYAFKNIPLYDAPVLIAEKSMVLKSSSNVNLKQKA